jgi:predicted transcriptional regulator
MERGGRRTGSGRKAASNDQDAWIAQQVNELVSATPNVRFFEHAMRHDSKLKSALESEEEYIEELHKLPSEAQKQVLEAFTKIQTDAPERIQKITAHLQDLADDLAQARKEVSEGLFSGRWVRRGGREVKELSPLEWSKIYDKIALLASEKFGRRFTRRSIANAMARDKKHFLEGPFFWPDDDKP